MQENKPEAAEVITSYKGFNKDWTCRGFQYALGESYEHKGEVAACEGGFHACEDPLHVLRYYSPAKSRYAVVEQSGDLSRHEEDSKVASRKITVKAEIDIVGLVKAGIEWRTKRCTPVEGKDSHLDNAAVTAKGRNESAASSGNYGAATASGYSGAATASGDSGAATASGDSGAATASGNYGAATASGDSGAATASGDYGAAMSSGRNGKAQGKEGCALFLTYRDANWKIVHAKAAIVGQNGIKADTFYKLNADGEFVEAD